MNAFQRGIRFFFATVLTLAGTATAYAGTLAFNGDTIGGPTFNRPVNLTALSGVGTNVNYETIGFTVDVADNYRIEILGAAFPAASGGFVNDTHINLYTGIFNPLQPLLNLIALNDDAGVGALSLLTANLLSSTNYVLVVTAFNNGAFGAYNGEIVGQTGTASLTSSQVPVPATLVLIAAGIALLIRRDPLSIA
jgi:hypothetical protein